MSCPWAVLYARFSASTARLKRSTEPCSLGSRVEVQLPHHAFQDELPHVVIDYGEWSASGAAAWRPSGHRLLEPTGAAHRPWPFGV